MTHHSHLEKFHFSQEALFSLKYGVGLSLGDIYGKGERFVAYENSTTYNNLACRFHKVQILRVDNLYFRGREYEMSEAFVHRNIENRDKLGTLLQRPSLSN